MQGIGAYVGTKRSLIGVDWLNLASGALKTTGGAFGGGGGGGGDAAVAAAEKARLEEQKRAAEQSAANWKLIGIVGALVVAGGAFVMLRK